MTKEKGYGDDSPLAQHGYKRRCARDRERDVERQDVADAEVESARHCHGDDCERGQTPFGEHTA